MCQCMYVYSSHDLCAHVQMVCNEGTVLTLKTNYGAPNYRVMNVDLNKPERVSNFVILTLSI